MKNVKSVSNPLKLNIWMEKEIYVKIVKKAFEKVVAMATA